MAKRKLSLTERKLIEMLGENTGRNMLDSGGAYGRHWERNQGRGWINEPAATIEFECRDGKLGIDGATLNVFHYLRERLTYSPSMNRKWRAFCRRADNRDDYELANMDKFAAQFDRHAVTVNTYNGEDALSQTLQYTAFEGDDGGAYVLLQIHGGCDVRGGYTDAVCFEIDEGEKYGLCDNARITIGETGKGEDSRMWDSDNAGYSFEPQESYCGQGLFGPIYRKAWDMDSTPCTCDPDKLGDGTHFVVIGKDAYSPDGYKLAIW